MYIYEQSQADLSIESTISQGLKIARLNASHGLENVYILLYVYTHKRDMVRLCARLFILFRQYIDKIKSPPAPNPLPTLSLLGIIEDTSDSFFFLSFFFLLTPLWPQKTHKRRRLYIHNIHSYNNKGRVAEPKKRIYVNGIVNPPVLFSLHVCVCVGV